MDSKRRYSEDEVARILDEATEAQTNDRRLPASGSGTTLDELQDIAREVGIPTDLITQAAARLDRPAPTAMRPQRFLGADIGVGRTVHLERPLTDAEWDRLVVDLRETFNARGRVRREGNFREWTNGNLQALLEPTEAGEQLRLRTVKGSAVASMRGGATIMGVGVLLMAALFLTGSAVDWSQAMGPIFFALMGGGLFASGRLSLPTWAATRQRQMEGVADRLIAAIQEPETPA